MRRDGFTLVEIMVAFSILAFLAVMIYGVVNATVQAHDQIEAILQETAPPPAVLNIIRQDIESAFIPDAEISYFKGVNQTGLFGPADRLDFVSTTMAYGRAEEDAEDQFHAINEVGYQLKQNPNSSDFMVLYRREAYFVDDEPTEGGTLVELYDRVKSFSLQYWDGEKWRSEWDSLEEDGALPLAVMVELKIEPETPDPDALEPASHVIVIPLLQ